MQSYFQEKEEKCAEKQVAGDEHTPEKMATDQIKIMTKYMVMNRRHLMNQRTQSREMEEKKHELAGLRNKQEKKINSSKKSRPHYVAQRATTEITHTEEQD